MNRDTVRGADPPVGAVETLRHIAGIGLAGLVTGITVGGIGARIFMRIAGATGRPLAQGLTTEAGFRVGEITAGGTIALIVFVGILFGILGAVVFVVVRPWLAWAGRWRGAVFGIVLFAIGSASSDVMNPDNRDFFLLANDIVNVVAIGVLFLLFGVVMEWSHRWLDRRLPRGTTWITIFGVITGLGAVIGLPLMITTMFTDGGCDCGPSPWIAWSVVVMGLGTVGWWLGGRREVMRGPAMLAGYLGLLGAVGFGMVRAISDAAEILG